MHLDTQKAGKTAEGKILLFLNMKSFQIDIINPKALKLLQDLADLKLISIKENRKQDFMEVVSKLREKASSNPPSLEEITEEVEIVRARRYAKKG